MAIPDPPQAASRTFALGAGAIILLTCLAYLSSLGGIFLVNDGQHLMIGAEPGEGGLGKIWSQAQATPRYQPLTYTTFWLESHLWPLSPPGYRMINLLLHIGASLALWRLLVRLNLEWAWLAAAVFALHPLQVESVAWISQRGNLLAGLLALLACQAWLRFLNPGSAGAPNPWRWPAYGLALGLFALALLSRINVCILPVVLLLLMWWKRGRPREALSLVPLLGLALGAVLLTIRMETGGPPSPDSPWQELSGLEWLLAAARAVWFYATQWFLPYGQTVIYPLWNVDGSLVWQYFYPAAGVGALVALGWTRARIGRGPMAGVLIFTACLIPGLGLFDLQPLPYSFVADHVQYLAGAGLLGLAAGLGAWAARRAEIPPELLRSFTGAILVILLALTWSHGRAFQNSESLWLQTTARNPSGWFAQDSLGTIRLDQGLGDEAVAHFLKALRANPDQGKIHLHLANAYTAQKKTDLALEHYQRAISLQDDYFQAHNNLANLLDSLGRGPEALAHFRRAIELAPNQPEPHNNLALNLAEAGDFDQAIPHFEQALRLRSDFAQAHYGLGTILLQKSQMAQATDHLGQALALRPADYGPGVLRLTDDLIQQGRVSDALQVLQRILETAPANPAVRLKLGDALRRAGRPKEALEKYRQALELQPDFLPAVHAHAWIMATCPDPDVRNGPLAVEISQWALTASRSNHPALLDTLAAAYAECGEYERAAQTAWEALQIARTDKMMEGLAKAIEVHWNEFRAYKPYRDVAESMK